MNSLCKKCLRSLRSEKSKKRGFGPSCWRKYQNDGNRQSFFDEYESPHELPGEM